MDLAVWTFGKQTLDRFVGRMTKKNNSDDEWRTKHPKMAGMILSFNSDRNENTLPYQQKKFTILFQTAQAALTVRNSKENFYAASC